MLGGSRRPENRLSEAENGSKWVEIAARRCAEGQREGLTPSEPAREPVPTVFQAQLQGAPPLGGLNDAFSSDFEAMREISRPKCRST